MQKPLTLFLLLAPVLTTGLLAQPLDIRFEHLGVEDGLSDIRVTSIWQDRHGFMWFGTEDGLNKYDGYTFTIYRNALSDSTSISSNYVEEIIEDSQGNLWIGTRGGLNRYDPAKDTFIRYRYDEDDSTSLGSDWILSLYETRDGTLWIGTRDRGLSRFDRATETFTRYVHDPADPNSLSDSAVFAIYEDRAGVLWIGTGWPWGQADPQAGGLCRFEPLGESFTCYKHNPDDPNSLKSNHVMALYEDSLGTFWVGTWGGLHTMDREQGTFTRYRYDPRYPETLNAIASGFSIAFIHEDRSGRLWIGGWEGIVLYDRDTETVSHFTHDPDDPHSLNSSEVWEIYEDRLGTVWIGCGGWSCLEKVVPTSGAFQHYQPAVNRGQGSRVLAIYEDRDGVLWFGNGSGLNRVDQTTGAFRQYRHDPKDATSLSSDWIQAIYEDREGTLWVGTLGGGLNQMDRTSGTFRQYQHDPEDSTSLGYGWVWDIYEDGDGALWVGTNGGLNRMDREAGNFRRYQHTPADSTSLSDAVVLVILEDRDGVLWVGTNGGLNRFDREHERFVPYEEGPSVVLDLHEDAKGRFWVATGSNGLYLFDRATGTSTRFTTEDGLPSNLISSILEDDSGRLWLGTEKGLSRFDPEHRTFRNYDRSDGLPITSFRHNAAQKSRRGEFFFGGYPGLVAFFPDRFTDDPQPPEVVLTSFRLFHKPVTAGANSPLQQPIWNTASLTLAHDQNVFSFDFAGLHYRNPEKNRHQFMLEGYDEVWREAGAERRAAYVKVPPGKYTFRVKAANSDGVWNEEGTSLAITIHPPWWQTGWAYVVYTLLVIGAVIAAFRVQHSRIVRKEREQWLLKEKDLRANAAEAWANYLQSENLRQTQELEAARDLQLSMLPETMPEHPAVELAAFMETATEVGGDYYDFDLAEHGTLTIAIGDATGHGTKAGTMVTATKSLWHAFSREPDLALVLEKSSRALKQMGLPKLYMALALARLRDHTLELVGAGLPPALVYRAGTGEVETVPLKGMPLGGPGRARYRKQCVMLSPGDTVALMTDGFPERFSDTGEMLGYDRAVAMFAEVAARSSEEIIGHLMKRCEAWANGREQDDDVTFVVMKMKASTDGEGVGTD